jgi:uncharacterized protein (TIGR03067 family)
VSQGSTVANEEWSFAGRELTIKTNTDGLDRFSVSADRSKTPAEINLTKVSPNTPPTEWIGIFQFEGGSLVICLSPLVMEGIARPRELRVDPEELQMMWRLKRKTDRRTKGDRSGIDKIGCLR